ncbi:MAG TPA: NADPH-dependent FMN reductase [Bacteroidales bacterium]|nr:NADPH-dependent FMN reductase [Bacteroidales bacterium]
MSKVVVISSSVRADRYSHRVALYFKNYFEEKELAEAEILDLKSYNFPLFDERLKYQKAPSAAAVEFAEKVRHADGVIIVTPEYNGGYPACLKNVVDLLTDEWHKKPVAISTVSEGNFGGVQLITSLQFVLWKMKAWTVNAMFPVSRVSETFDENGIPADKEATDKRASGFVSELLWCIEAKARMKK